MTYGRGCPVAPGINFEKVWRVRNDSGGPWPAEVQLMHVGGDEFGSVAPAAVRGDVAPGEEVDLSVTLTAPTASGHYTGHWRLVDATGHRFGPRFAVSVVVPASSDEEAPGGAGAGGGDAEGARDTHAMNVAAVQALLASSEHRGDVELLATEGLVDLANPVQVSLLITRLAKWNGNMDRARKFLFKFAAKQAKLAAKHAKWSTKRAAMQAKKDAKRAAKQAKKDAKRAAKQAKQDAKRAAKQARKDARVGAGKSDSDSSSSSSGSGSSDSSSSASDDE